MVISVIIPIYNTQLYLEQCIRSVLNQTYREIEVLLINDGSTDHSRELCSSLAEQDSRIRLIDKKNGGLSDARNVGIGSAGGEYCVFLDSDDYWSDNGALQRLYDRILKKPVDVLNYSYVKFLEDKNAYIPYFDQISDMPLDIKEGKLQKEYLIGHGLFIASACNKMIRRKLFDENDLQFEKGIYSEDIEWCCRLFQYAETVDFCCENFYIYRQRSSSITHTINDKKCTDLKNNIIKCIHHGMENSEDQNLIFMYSAYQFGTFFITQALAGNKQKNNIDELSHYQWILKYHGRNKKLIVLFLLTRFMGVRITCNLVRLFFWKKRN